MTARPRTWVGTAAAGVRLAPGRRHPRCVGWVAIATVAWLAACGAERELDLVVRGVSVIDVEAGSVQPDRTIGIRSGRIVTVGPAGDGGTQPAQRCLDGRGRYAIPGLWDMHVHALWEPSVAESFLQAFLRHGVTGVRDMGGDPEVLERVRAAPEATREGWPRIFAAGPVLDGPQPVDPTISVAEGTAAEAAAAVDRLSSLGVDFIKVYTLLPRAAYFAAVERAAQVGLPVAGHIPGEVTVLEAVRAGQASIEHLRDELGPFCEELDELACDSLIAEMVKAGVHNTPTLGILQAKTVPGYGLSPGLAAETDLPVAVRTHWEEMAAAHAERPAEYFDWRAARLAEEIALVGRLHRAGGPILAGTDTGTPSILPGTSLHRELELLVEAGLTAPEALYSATLGATRFLGIDDVVGSLGEGQAADLVLLEGNPLERISNVERIAAVVRHGRVLELPGAEVAGACPP